MKRSRRDYEEEMEEEDNEDEEMMEDDDDDEDEEVGSDESFDSRSRSEKESNRKKRRMAKFDKKRSLAIQANSNVIGEKMTMLLEKIETMEDSGSGAFYVSGVLSDVPLTIKLKKDGTQLRFPVPENEFDALIPKLEQAPFERGEKTIVRNSWQLSPKDFEVNKKWNNIIPKMITPAIAKKFCLTPDSFEAKLYKLLLYKTGSFFKPYRDSEKEEGMFGTLIVQLPSKFTGGQLIVSHDGCTTELDYSTKGNDNEEFLIYYSAFYCDCEHEVRPLLSGVRVCMVFNLVLTKNMSDVPRAPSATGRKEELANILKEWRVYINKEKAAKRKLNCIEARRPQPDPSLLVYLMSHQYSRKSLTYKNLKGSDKAVANFLMEMANDLEIAALFGIMDDYEEEFDDEADIKIEDHHIFALDTDLKAFVGGGSESLRCDSISCTYKELIPKLRFSNLQPCDKDKQDTGNEGVEVRQYRSACIVIFPSEHIFSHCRNSKSLPDPSMERLLLSKLDKYKSSGDTDKQKLKACTLAFANQFLESQQNIVESSVDQKNLLEYFVILDDKELLIKFIKSYWNVISSGLGTFLSTAHSNKKKPLWDFLFKEVKKEMVERTSIVPGPSAVSKRNTETPIHIPTSECISAIRSICKTKDKSLLLSAFLQMYGRSLLGNVDELLPVVIGTSNTFGKDFIRAEIMKLLEKEKTARNENNATVTWTPSLNAIDTIDDNDNQLLSKFLVVFTSLIKQEIDAFLSAILARKSKLGDQFIRKELTRIFRSDSDAPVFSSSAKRLITVFRDLAEFKDSNLLKEFISSYLPTITTAWKELLPSVLLMEDAFGWDVVSGELLKILKSIKDPFQRIEVVKKIRGERTEGNPYVTESCYEYLKFILQDFKVSTSTVSYSYYSKSRPARPGLSDTQIQNILKNIDQFGLITHADMAEFLQTRNDGFAVELLKDVASGHGNQLNGIWLNIATDLFRRLSTTANTPVVEVDFKIRNDFQLCSSAGCSYCPEIQCFMQDPNKIQETFKIPKPMWEGSGGHGHQIEKMRDIGVTGRKIKIYYAWILTKQRRISVQKKLLQEKSDAEKHLGPLKNLLIACKVDINSV